MKAKNAHPTDPVFVIEVRASHSHKALGSGGGISGGRIWISDGKFKEADIPAIASGIRTAFKKASAYLDGAKPPVVLRSWKYDESIEVEFWHGTRNQFEPRPSDRKVLWSNRGNLGAKVLSTNAPPSEDELKAALQSIKPRAQNKTGLKP